MVSAKEARVARKPEASVNLQTAGQAGRGSKLAPGGERELVVAEGRQISEGGQPGADQAGGDGQQEERQRERRCVAEQRPARRRRRCQVYRL